MNNMTKYFILFALLFFSTAPSFAQSQKVKVMMNDGAVIIGTIIRMDASKSLTLDVAGFETEISMADVSTINPAEDNENQLQPSSKGTHSELLQSDAYGEYVVMDDTDRPGSFVILIDNQKFTMVLVRGGVFNMGYNGSGSMKFDSEPVHKVRVSSFYVSQEFVNADVAYKLMGKNYNSMTWKRFVTKKWNEAKRVVDKIAEQEGLPYRLLTEAEWEYASLVSAQKDVLKDIVTSYAYKNGICIGEWCNDVWARYT